MKSRLLMYLSLIILAIGLVGIYITQVNQPFTTESSTADSLTQTEAQAPPEKTIKIWRTKEAVIKGQQVARSDFKVDEIPESEAFELGIEDDVELQFPDVLVMKMALEKDSPALPEYFITPEEDGYFRYVLEDGYLPVPISVRANAVVGDVIQAGSIVDILALTSTTQNLTSAQIRDLANVSLTTILSGVKVLQVFKKSNVEENIEDADGRLGSGSDNKVPMILQLTKDQAAKVSMAQGIAQLEIMLSSDEDRGKYIDIDLGDIITDFKPVRELRVKR
ncbi:hypothetical protein MAQ5080_00405 [Marinomonas aquimarina]|uniref:Flp pilus assembly protein RcpC/CpaB domain-containing protein n=1 Tax=Marinomonas aquimarina TaxID=295068 RepID=A0A1A8T2G6_9GAMM|nr:Flp pilus assembly protein CpaB [Marinomonas aquimarina]SBS25912.1 hypothetical protein MAQ5080_00405 [Marinomonas aquimarina]